MGWGPQASPGPSSQDRPPGSWSVWGPAACGGLCGLPARQLASALALTGSLFPPHFSEVHPAPGT